MPAKKKIHIPGLERPGAEALLLEALRSRKLKISDIHRVALSDKRGQYIAWTENDILVLGDSDTKWTCAPKRFEEEFTKLEVKK